MLYAASLTYSELESRTFKLKEMKKEIEEISLEAIAHEEEELQKIIHNKGESDKAENGAAYDAVEGMSVYISSCLLCLIGPNLVLPAGLVLDKWIYYALTTNFHSDEVKKLTSKIEKYKEHLGLEFTSGQGNFAGTALVHYRIISSDCYVFV